MPISYKKAGRGNVVSEQTKVECMILSVGRQQAPTLRWPAKAADRSRVETSERRVKDDNMVREKD